MKLVFCLMFVLYVSWSFAAYPPPDGTTNLGIFGKQTVFNGGTGDVKYVSGDKYGVANVDNPNLEIVKGNIEGVTYQWIRSVDSSIETTKYVFGEIWGTAEVPLIVTTAISIEVSSTSANDKAAGTGARTILVTGLDNDFLEQSESANLNGTSAVSLTKKYVAVNDMYVSVWGSANHNVGDIYAYSAEINLVAGRPGDLEHVMNGISAEISISRSGIYTVPDDKNVYLMANDFYVGFTVNTTISTFGSCCTGLIREYFRIHASTAPVEKGYFFPFSIPSKTTIFSKAISVSATKGSFLLELRIEDE